MLIVYGLVRCFFAGVLCWSFFLYIFFHLHLRSINLPAFSPTFLPCSFLIFLHLFLSPTCVPTFSPVHSSPHLSLSPTAPFPPLPHPSLAFSTPPLSHLLHSPLFHRLLLFLASFVFRSKVLVIVVPSIPMILSVSVHTNSSPFPLIIFHFFLFY